MIVISSREFRQNQRLYFDKVDKGEQIIVQRGKDKSYTLTPVNEEDMYFTKEMIAKMDESLRQMKSGQVKQITTPNEIKDLLGL